MALNVGVDDVWNCPQHPSARRRTGICPVCLRQRLALLCPECANERPCNCYAASSSSSSSARSSFSCYSRYSAAAAEGIGAVGRVSSLIESEPVFRRSRSVAAPTLRSKPAVSCDYSFRKDTNKFLSLLSSLKFWSLFKNRSGGKSKRVEVERYDAVASIENAGKKKADEEERRRMMRKSRSVAVASDPRIGDVRSTKSKGWYFPSPIKLFRPSVTRSIVQERSPL